MFICLDKELGSIAVSDEPLSDKYIICDGRNIERSKYPELFKALRIEDDVFKVPDRRHILNGIEFYMIGHL